MQQKSRDWLGSQGNSLMRKLTSSQIHRWETEGNSHIPGNKALSGLPSCLQSSNPISRLMTPKPISTVPSQSPHLSIQLPVGWFHFNSLTSTSKSNQPKTEPMTFLPKYLSFSVFSNGGTILPSIQVLKPVFPKASSSSPSSPLSPTYYQTS